MIWQGENLVRVTSHGELKAGMMVVFRGQCRCGATEHAMILLRKDGGFPPCVDGHGWQVAGICGSPPRTCFCICIPAGRLYRLQEPPAEANDYDVQAVPTKAKEGCADVSRR